MDNQHKKAAEYGIRISVHICNKVASLQTKIRILTFFKDLYTSFEISIFFYEFLHISTNFYAFLRISTNFTNFYNFYKFLQSSNMNLSVLSQWPCTHCTRQNKRSSCVCSIFSKIS